ncbi:hypothetical protein XENTR_v10015512 [Xenopus tropicalis]|nr:hypothetical protein XENTR_v10015512 [Xenopus tropicalis]
MIYNLPQYIPYLPLFPRSLLFISLSLSFVCSSSSISVLCFSFTSKICFSLAFFFCFTCFFMAQPDPHRVFVNTPNCKWRIIRKSLKRKG